MDIGIWTDVEYVGKRDKWDHKLYSVKCKYCGRVFTMTMHDIKRPKHCQHDKINIKDSRLRRTFYGMVDRCYNKEDKAFRWYGDKGIKICEEWLEDNSLFESWALSNGYKDNLTIDRIDSSKDYCPENCQWISLRENSRKKSSTRFIDVDGERRSGRQWADKLGIGTNFINTYFRKHGEEKTIEYIREKLKTLN